MWHLHIRKNINTSNNLEVCDLILPVILCGGSGTRLWPVSRSAYPKQFVAMHGEGSLYQQALKRVSGSGFADPVVITSDQFRFTAAEQLQSVDVERHSILLEPEGRNTAPAVLAVSLWAAARDPKAVLLLVPSDHVIPDADAFKAAVFKAFDAAVAGSIVTFGIQPDRPETGYGYLEVGQSFLNDCKSLKRFVEKPNFDQAEEMVGSGNYLWNAGIFLFRADVMIAAFERFAPDMILPAKKAVEQAITDLDFIRLDAEQWSKLPKISIDYAIMEKADNLSVMPYDGRWSDLGSWSAVAEQYRDLSDDAGNIVLSNAHAIDCENSFLRGDDDGPHLVGLGLKDVVAVATKDAVLLSARDQTQGVREVVEVLTKDGVKQAKEFSRDFRPWGWFESLAVGERFQVKRIVVKPGGVLSLQSHKHRAEHWVVVEGIAKVTIEDTVMMVSENQSVYVPLGAIHRMENPGTTPMVLIEVQTGSYLGEDDIVRYEDLYDRT